jgi:hypothetical protein
MSIEVTRELKTQIDIALMNDNLEFIKDIVSKMENINQVIYPVQNKYCLLATAVSYEASKVVNFLINNGANVNNNPYKDPILFLATRKAAHSGKIDIVEMLINANANISTVDFTNRTILDSLKYNLTNLSSNEIITDAPYYNQVVELIEKYLNK